MLHGHHEETPVKNFALPARGEKTYSKQQHTCLLFYLNFFVYIYKLLTKGAFFCNSVMSFLSFNVQFYCFFKKEGGEKNASRHFTVGLQSGTDKRSLCTISNIHAYLSNSIWNTQKLLGFSYRLQYSLKF